VPVLVSTGQATLGTKLELKLGDGRVAYSGEFANGGFETGDLTGWVASGDGRVISGLGGFRPTEGKFTGLLSTGLGFTTGSGAIEQHFCLPADAKQLAFDWNFSSEEFIEWCGSQFDDSFRVEIRTDGGPGPANFFSESVNTLCGAVSPTTLAFDQSGPGCTPTEGVGMGTGGNDCKVWSRGWQSQSIDLSPFASEPNKAVLLSLTTSDRGDSSFDTAVLIDNIRLIR
jgi:hypothetical protein